jgi:hypothetical protein
MGVNAVVMELVSQFGRCATSLHIDNSESDSSVHPPHDHAPLTDSRFSVSKQWCRYCEGPGIRTLNKIWL